MKGLDQKDVTSDDEQMLKNLDVDGVMVGFLVEICLTGDFLLTLVMVSIKMSVQKSSSGIECIVRTGYSVNSNDLVKLTQWA